MAFSVMDYGAVADGVTNDAAAFAACDAAAGSEECLAPSGTYLISTNTTLSAPWRLEAGTVLTGSATVTFNGIFTAPPTPVFDEDFPVVFGAGAVDGVQRRWFEAAADKDSLLDAAAVANATGVPVLMGDETVDLGAGSTEVTCTVPLWIEGTKGLSVITNGWRFRCNENTTIRGVTFKDFVKSTTSRGYMLQLRVGETSGNDIDTLIIEDCTFLNTNAAAIESLALLASEDVPVTGSIDTLSICRNHFENVSSAVELRTPITSGLIADNTFVNINAQNIGGEAYAIRVGANFDDATWDDANTRNVIIRHNRVVGMDAQDARECHAIIVYGSGHQIIGNYIEDIQGNTDKEGIYVRGGGIVVAHNILIDAAGDGINSSDGALVCKAVPDAKRNIIAHNVIYYRDRGGETGIRCWNHENGLIVGNIVMADASRQVDTAIHCHGGWTVADNRIYLAGGGAGIQVAHDYADPTDDQPSLTSTVRGNYVYTTGNGHGIRAGYTTDCDITNNWVWVEGSAGTGMGIQATSDGSTESPNPTSWSTRTTIQGNRVRCGLGNCIYVKNGNAVLVADNRLFNSDRYWIRLDNESGSTSTVDIARNWCQMNSESATTANPYCYIDTTLAGATVRVRVLDNVFEGTTTASGGRWPFQLGGSTVEFIGNKCFTAQSGTAVPLLYVPSTTVTTMVVTGNYFGPEATATKLTTHADAIIGTLVCANNTAISGSWYDLPRLPLTRLLGPEALPVRYTDLP